jgi:hypothetical protein
MVFKPLFWLLRDETAWSHRWKWLFLFIKTVLDEGAPVTVVYATSCWIFGIEKTCPVVLPLSSQFTLMFLLFKISPFQATHLWRKKKNQACRSIYYLCRRQIQRPTFKESELLIHTILLDNCSRQESSIDMFFAE